MSWWSLWRGETFVNQNLHRPKFAPKTIGECPRAAWFDERGWDLLTIEKRQANNSNNIEFQESCHVCAVFFWEVRRVLHTSFCDSHSVMFGADARCVVPLLACLFSLGKMHGWTVLSDSRLICPEPNDLDDFSQLLKPLTRGGGISVAFLNDIVSHWNRPYQIRFQGPLLISFLAYPMSHPSHRSWNRELTFPLHLPERRVPTTARRICKI